MVDYSNDIDNTLKYVSEFLHETYKLKYVDGLPSKQIAILTGTTVANVNSRLYKARMQAITWMRFADQMAAHQQTVDTNKAPAVTVRDDSPVPIKTVPAGLIKCRICHKEHFDYAACRW